MEVKIKVGNDEKTIVEINCQEVNEKIENLRKYILNYELQIIGKDYRGKHLVDLNQVYYFESIDNKTFLYTQDNELEVQTRLYELESNYFDNQLFRINKSQIVNLKQVISLRPQIDRTMIITLVNQEKLYVSRKYTSLLKKKLKL